MDGTGKTFKELNVSEREMVRILMHATDCPYKMREVADKFNLSRASLSGIKSNKTFNRRYRKNQK